MTSQEFIQLLDARIAKYDLLCHPFYKAWSAGQLSREDLREYAREYFHHVEVFPSYLDEFAARLPHNHMRRAVLANREAAGGTHLPEMKNLIRSFHAVAREGAPEEALAAFYAYESQVPRVAAAKAKGLREMYDADEKTYGYFTLHTTADVYHSRVWESQLERIVEDSPAALG